MATTKYLDKLSGNTLKTQVGSFPVNMDWVTAAKTADTFRGQTGYTPENKEAYQYWSTKANILDSLARNKSGDPSVPDEVLNVRLKNWEENWLPRSSEFEGGAVSAGGVDDRGYGWSSLEAQGYNINDIQKSSAQKQAQMQRADNNKGFTGALRKTVGTVVPLAIGAGFSALGGQALGLGTLTGLGSALKGGAGATGVSAGNAAATGGLGSAFGNFSTNAALSGALKGGIGGFMSGDGLSGALKGAGLGGLTGGYGGALASGLGLQGAGSQAFQGALTGASGGIATGDAKTAGLGAALGGVGGYVKAGGNVPGLGNLQETLPSGVQGAPRPGTGILGELSNLTNTATGSLSGLTGGNTSMLGDALKIGGAFYEDSATRKNNEAIARQLAEAQGRAQRQLSPYVQAGADATGRLSASLAQGFNPGDLTQDPGYQFRLQQGEEALARRMAASGLGQSGAALKAAQEYGQGLADQTYNDAFQRYQATNAQNQALSNQGLGAASGAAGLDMYGGQNLAELMANNQESKNNRLSSILSGIGAFF